MKKRSNKLKIASIEESFDRSLNERIENRVRLEGEIRDLKSQIKITKEHCTRLEIELAEYKMLDDKIKTYKEDKKAVNNEHHRQMAQFEESKRKLIEAYESQIKILEDSNPNAHNISIFADMCKKQGLVLQQGQRNEAKDLPGIYMHMMPNGKAYVGMAKTQPLKRRWDCGKNVDDELNNYNSEFTADMHRFGGPKSVRTIWAYVPIEWEKHTVESIESALILAGDYTNTGYNRKR